MAAAVSVGLVVGVIVLVAIVLFVLYKCYLRRRDSKFGKVQNPEFGAQMVKTDCMGGANGNACRCIIQVCALLSTDEFLLCSFASRLGLKEYCVVCCFLDRCKEEERDVQYSGRRQEASRRGCPHQPQGQGPVSSIVMLIAYFAYLIFQLWTHRQLFEDQEDSDDDEGVESEECAVIGFWSGFAWLIDMTGIVALLSAYVVATIEDASDSWGLSIAFISIILLPIVGNAAEHAGAIIFAFKNKLDISLGVALGSATQISMFLHA